MLVTKGCLTHYVKHNGEHYMYDGDSWWTLDHTVMHMVQDDSLEDELNAAWNYDWAEYIQRQAVGGISFKDILEDMGE